MFVLTSDIPDDIIGEEVAAMGGGTLNLNGFFQAFRDFVYGMAGYEFEQHAVETRSSLENLFMAVTFGDMLGLPIVPPYYSLRMLPFVVPNIVTWKRRVSRERELSDDHSFDLHGV